MTTKNEREHVGDKRKTPVTSYILRDTFIALNCIDSLHCKPITPIFLIQQQQQEYNGSLI